MIMPTNQPQTALQVLLPVLHPAQQQIRKSKARFRVVACGRRFGKSTLALEEMIDVGLKGQPVPYCAPTYKMLTDQWRVLKDMLGEVTAEKREHEFRLELYTGGSVTCW